MTPMTINWIFIAIILFFMLIGFLRGTMMTVLSTIIWAVAALIAILVNPALGDWIASFGALSHLGHLLAGIVVLLAILLLGIVPMWMCSLATKASTPSMSSRLMGTLISIIKGGFCILAVVFILDMTAFATTPVWKSSQLVKVFQPWVQVVQQLPAEHPTLSSDQHSQVSWPKSHYKA